MGADGMSGGRPKGTFGTHVGSRKYQMDALEVGEFVLFPGEPGQPASKLQASIGSSYRGGQNMSNQGLEQSSGFLVFEGELPRPVVKVTRISEPKA